MTYMNTMVEWLGIGPDLELELETWFSTPGDADDFIFFGENENAQSER